MFPEIEERGIDGAVRLLGDVEQRLGDQSPAWRLLREDVADLEAEYWSSKGDGTWPEAKESTKARDARADKAHPKRDAAVMVASGRLRKEATRRTSKAGRDFILLELRSSTYYSLFLANSGREAIGVPDDAEIGRYVDAVTDFILTGVARRA